MIFPKSCDRVSRAKALLLAAAVTLPCLAQPPEELQRKFDDAERRITRLSPASFSGLPAGIVRELQRRGCTIPQTGYTKKPHNVIRGEFARPGQTDWAVLCSVKGTSSILVFWNGSDKDPAAIAPFQDRIFLQGVNPTDVYYSRGINPVGKDFIMGHYKAYGGTKPPAIDHQGIDDAFIEKASVVWYFHDGQWLKLTGSD